MDITLLDGGLGQELVARSGKPAHPLWSVQVMLDLPELVREVHSAFFDAGATIATANTYSVLRDRLARHDIEDRLVELQTLACTLAGEAREAAGSGRVAGSFGPLGMSYRPDLAPAADAAAKLYDEIARIQAPLVDLFLLETMASVDQARGALRGALGHGRPVWLSLSVDDADGTRLRSGEALEAVLPVLEERRPEAVLLNCSVPEAIGAGLAVLARSGLRYGAYANGFTEITEAFRRPGATVDALRRRTDLDPETYARHALSWVEGGASIVGGCCEVGPSHIAVLARRLREAGHEVV